MQEYNTNINLMTLSDFLTSNNNWKLNKMKFILEKRKFMYKTK